MTHITGPRPRVVKRTKRLLMGAIGMAGCTTTEYIRAMHEIEFETAKRLLNKLEADGCPTCPKPKKRGT